MGNVSKRSSMNKYWCSLNDKKNIYFSLWIGKNTNSIDLQNNQGDIQTKSMQSKKMETWKLLSI